MIINAHLNLGEFENPYVSDGKAKNSSNALVEPLLILFREYFPAKTTTKRFNVYLGRLVRS